MTIMGFFSDKLKDWMTAHNKQQQDLAFDLRVDPAMLSKVLNGKLGAPSSLIEKLAAYEPLGVDEDTLKLWVVIDKVGPETIQAAAMELAFKGHQAIKEERKKK